MKLPFYLLSLNCFLFCVYSLPALNLNNQNLDLDNLIQNGATDLINNPVLAKAVLNSIENKNEKFEIVKEAVDALQAQNPNAKLNINLNNIQNLLPNINLQDIANNLPNIDLNNNDLNNLNNNLNNLINNNINNLNTNLINNLANLNLSGSSLDNFAQVASYLNNSLISEELRNLLLNTLANVINEYSKNSTLSFGFIQQTVLDLIGNITTNQTILQNVEALLPQLWSNSSELSFQNILAMANNIFPNGLNTSVSFLESLLNSAEFQQFVEQFLVNTISNSTLENLGQLISSLPGLENFLNNIFSNGNFSNFDTYSIVEFLNSPEFEAVLQNIVQNFLGNLSFIDLGPYAPILTSPQFQDLFSAFLFKYNLNLTELIQSPEFFTFVFSDNVLNVVDQLLTNYTSLSLDDLMYFISAFNSVDFNSLQQMINQLVEGFNTFNLTAIAEILDQVDLNALNNSVQFQKLIASLFPNANEAISNFIDLVEVLNSPEILNLLEMLKSLNFENANWVDILSNQNLLSLLSSPEIQNLADIIMPNGSQILNSFSDLLSVLNSPDVQNLLNLINNFDLANLDQFLNSTDLITLLATPQVQELITSLFPNANETLSNLNEILDVINSPQVVEILQLLASLNFENATLNEILSNPLLQNIINQLLPNSSFDLSVILNLVQDYQNLFNNFDLASLEKLLNSTDLMSLLSQPIIQQFIQQYLPDLASMQNMTTEELLDFVLSQLNLTEIQKLHLLKFIPELIVKLADVTSLNEAWTVIQPIVLEHLNYFLSDAMNNKNSSLIDNIPGFANSTLDLLYKEFISSPEFAALIKLPQIQMLFGRLVLNMGSFTPDDLYYMISLIYVPEVQNLLGSFIAHSSVLSINDWNLADVYYYLTNRTDLGEVELQHLHQFIPDLIAKLMNVSSVDEALSVLEPIVTYHVNLYLEYLQNNSTFIDSIQNQLEAAYAELFLQLVNSTEFANFISLPEIENIISKFTETFLSTLDTQAALESVSDDVVALVLNKSVEPLKELLQKLSPEMYDFVKTKDDPRVLVGFVVGASENILHDKLRSFGIIMPEDLGYGVPTMPITTTRLITTTTRTIDPSLIALLNLLQNQENENLNDIIGGNEDTGPLKPIDDIDYS